MQDELTQVEPEPSVAVVGGRADLVMGELAAHAAAPVARDDGTYAIA